MTLAGPVVLDIVQHFTERWNEIKKRKVRLQLLFTVLQLLNHDVLQYPDDKFVLTSMQ